MNKGELIKKLQDDPNPPDTEIMISERAMDNTHPLDSVSCGWYVDDGFDAPEVIDDTENPEDYGLLPDEPKVIVLE